MHNFFQESHQYVHECSNKFGFIPKKYHQCVLIYINAVKDCGLTLFLFADEGMSIGAQLCVRGKTVYNCT